MFDLLPEEDQAPAIAQARSIGPRAPALHHLPARDGRPLQGDYPHILYPPSGVTLALGQGRALSLEAGGGAPPYRWAVNGTALAPARLGESPAWQPDGPGFVHLTVTDRLDRSAQEDVRLQ